MEEEEEEEEPEESDWDVDLKEAQDYHARVSAPMRRLRQPPKVLLFRSQKHPTGWPAGVWPELPPKPDLVPRNRYEGKEQE